MKKWGILWSLLLLLIIVCPQQAGAEETPAFRPQLSVNHGRTGERVELSIPYDGSLGKIGAFLIRVEYDDSVFRYVRAQASAEMKAGYVLIDGGSYHAVSVYTLKNEASCLNAAGETFTYFFDVLADAMEGETSFRVTVEQVVSPVPESLCEDIQCELGFAVDPPPSEDARLLSLKPDVGQLTPDFVPGIYRYEMEVPFAVKTVSFQAEAVKGATWKVNRKNLGAGGTSVDYVLTVQAENRQSTGQYVVSVFRKEKETGAESSGEVPSVAPDPTEKPKAASTPKAASSKAAKSTAVPKEKAESLSKPSERAELESEEESSEAPVFVTTGNRAGGSGGLVIQSGIQMKDAALIFFLFVSAASLGAFLVSVFWKWNRKEEDKEGHDTTHWPEE